MAHYQLHLHQNVIIYGVNEKIIFIVERFAVPIRVGKRFSNLIRLDLPAGTDIGVYFFPK